jgi:hypothetical protein
VATRRAPPAIPVPAVYSKGMGLRVLNYDELELTGSAGQDGTAILQTDILASDQLLRIERIVVYGDSASLCDVTVYNGDDSPAPAPQRARDGTQLPSGYLAVAEYASFLNVAAGNCLTVEVTGANPGDQFYAAVQFQLCQRVIGQAQWPSS